MSYRRIKGSWYKTAKKISYENERLKCILRKKNGKWVYNEIEIPKIYLDNNVCFENVDGNFHINLNKNQEDIIMNELFPRYEGSMIDIDIDFCYMLSVDIPKYNELREDTIKILNDNVKIPQIKVFHGYTPKNYRKAKMSKYIQNIKNIRPELASGMLEMFDNVIKKYNTNVWFWYFEDDVRPVNMIKGENLKSLKIPKDAEMLIPIRGKNKILDKENVKYRISYNGGANQAILMSRNACIKVLNYAKKYKWLDVCDKDLYRLCHKVNECISDYDAWCGHIVLSSNKAIKIEQREKIITYSLDTYIFNQTSAPDYRKPMTM